MLSASCFHICGFPGVLQNWLDVLGVSFCFYIMDLVSYRVQFYMYSVMISITIDYFACVWTSYTWNHSVLSSQYLASFAQHVFEIHLVAVCINCVIKLNLGLLASLAAQPICWHQVVVEGTAFIARYQAWRVGSLRSRDPNSPMAFREGFFKATFGVRAVRCIIFFWLVGAEVTGWYFRNLNHQPSSSYQSGVYMLVVSM